MIVQPGLHLAHGFAEAQHHATFVRLDAEEAREQPDRDCGQYDQAEALAAEAAARQHRAQLVLAATQKLFEIGRRRTGRRRPRAPGTLASACPPRPAAPIAPPERLATHVRCP